MTQLIRTKKSNASSGVQDSRLQGKTIQEVLAERTKTRKRIPPRMASKQGWTLKKLERRRPRVPEPGSPADLKARAKAEAYFAELDKNQEAVAKSAKTPRRYRRRTRRPRKPPPKPQSGQLSILTYPPGATVEVNGKPMGRAPVAKAWPSFTDRLKVVVTAKGYQKHLAIVKPNERGEYVLRVALQPAPAAP